MSAPRTVGLLMLILAVATAGCTSLFGGGDDPGRNDTVQTTPDDGLSMTFRSISSTYLEDADIQLQMDLENTGQAEATDISVGLSGSGLIDGNDLVQSPVANLRPVDPGSGEAGGSTTAAWTAANGLDLGDGETQDITVTGSVSYDYRTTARSSFNVVPRAEQRGTEPVSVDNTAAPVHASIDFRTPHPVYEERSRNIASVPITVENVGDGEVSDLTFALSLPNVGDQVTLDGCAGTAPEDFPRDVTLFDDGTREIVCDINLTALTGRLQFESTVPLQVDLAYRYTEERQTGFTIEGLPGDRTG